MPFAIFRHGPWRAWLQRCGAVLACLCASPALALAEVSLQLKWTHAFQFAGYYAAVEKGYYRDAGLNVTLLEAVPGVDPLDVVTSGRAQYGVGTSSLLLARKAGLPVVVLAVVFQHSPLVLVARDVVDVRQLEGRRVMIEPQSDELLAYLQQEGVSLRSLVHQPHSLDVRDFIQGRTDAMSVYSTHEMYYVERAGIAYRIFSPRMAGIDFYGDNLFTTENELKVHPQRAQAFRAASLRGWQYAMDHPQEMADLILRKYTRQHPREMHLYEARQMQELMRTDLVEVGYMTQARWRHIAATYAQLGLLPDNYALEGFLYAAEPASVLLPQIAGGLLSALVLAGAVYMWRLRRALQRTRSALRGAQAEVEQLALHNTVTGLPEKRLFLDRLERDLAKVRREGGHGVLVLIGLGVPATEPLQVELRRRLQACVREADTLAHYAPDQLAVVSADLDRQAARAIHQAEQLAERIRSSLLSPWQARELAPQEHVDLGLRFAIGIALLDNLSSRADALRRAETALLRANVAGAGVAVMDTGQGPPVVVSRA